MRVQKAGDGKIVIQQVEGEDDMTVVKETVLAVDDKLIKEITGSKAWPNNRNNSTGVLADVISREALKLVQTPRPYPSKQNLCMKISNSSATITLKDVTADGDSNVTKPKKKKVICKKDDDPPPIIKEKGVNLYGFPQVAWEIVKNTVSESEEVDLITQIIKENINKFYGNETLSIQGGEKRVFVEHPVIATNNKTFQLLRPGLSRNDDNNEDVVPKEIANIVNDKALQHDIMKTSELSSDKPIHIAEIGDLGNVADIGVLDIDEALDDDFMKDIEVVKGDGSPDYESQLLGLLKQLQEVCAVELGDTNVFKGNKIYVLHF